MAKNTIKWLKQLFFGTLAACSTGLVYESVGLGMWSGGLPGPGLYPTALLVLITVIAISELLYKPVYDGATDVAEYSGDRGSRDAAWVGTSLLLVPLLLPLFGFRGVAFTYLIGLMIFLAPRLTWFGTTQLVMLSAGLAYGAHMLFSGVFKVFLPVGQFTGF